jgi:hypothetical protein
MPSPTYAIVAQDLESLVGDILAAGIIKIGLRKVGADPETATPDQMKKAIDAHIGLAIESFMGTEKAKVWAMRTKGTLDKSQSVKGGS